MSTLFELDLFFTGCYHLGCDKLMFLSFQFSYFNFFIFMFVLIRHLNCIFGAERCNRWRFHRRSLAVGHWFKRRFSAQTNYVATIIVMILAPKLKIFQMNQNKQYTHHRKCKDWFAKIALQKLKAQTEISDSSLFFEMTYLPRKRAQRKVRDRLTCWFGIDSLVLPNSSNNCENERTT